MTRLPTREQRKVTFVKGFMARGDQREGYDWEEVTISNISAHGMMVKCNEPPEVGAVVTIRRRGAGVQGIVRWVAGRRFGVMSEEAVDLEGFVAASAAELAGVNPAAMQPPRLVQRIWHWRRHGFE